MKIDVLKTVESSLQSVPNWKPYGAEWHKNKKGHFETDFKKNIKQMINFNYQGLEITGKDFVLVLGKGFSGEGTKARQYYQIEVMNLEKTKLYYSKKVQDRNTMEKGDVEIITPMLSKFSNPHFYLIQEPEKNKNFSALFFAKNSQTK